MGHYENIVKIEEMRKKMNEKDAVSAQNILDTMDIKKIKNMSDLNLIAEVYSENDRYDEAAELYLKIYEKTKSRKSLFQLLDLSIKRNKIEEAQDYLALYQKAAPKDFYKYIFRYKIDKLKGEPYETLIETLETLKHTDYIELWAYELAKTYYKAGMEKECIRECSDIILWFGEGIYVEKAKMLRAYYSGDKNIMEELKRRATDHAELQKEEKSDQKEEAVSLEQEIISVGGLLSKSGEEELEVNLKNEIQTILIQDQEENVSEEEEQTDFATKDLRNEKIEVSLENQSEREIAEQEVEDTLYQLLRQEDLEEEDRKLAGLSEKLQFDMDEVFGNFLHIDSIKKQLVKSLEDILDEHTMTVQIIITGNEGSGKTTLAKDITVFLNKSGRLKSSKIAKINAERLNSINVETKKETLRDCCLVVEEASLLKRNTIESILELSKQLQGNMAIIFEENKNNINQLFEECPKLMGLFKNRIHLPQYTSEELMGFALSCLKQQGYKLSPKAEKIFNSKVSNIIEQTEPKDTLERIFNLMQLVINSADLRRGKRSYELTEQDHLEDAKSMFVLPEDFEVKP